MVMKVGHPVVLPSGLAGIISSKRGYMCKVDVLTGAQVEVPYNQLKDYLTQALPSQQYSRGLYGKSTPKD